MSILLSGISHQRAPLEVREPLAMTEELSAKALRALGDGELLREEMQAIARQEFSRQRRRLGQLTPGQERAVEALLVSVVNKISHPIIQQMRRSAEEVETEFIGVWSGSAAASREKEGTGFRQLIGPALV